MTNDSQDFHKNKNQPTKEIIKYSFEAKNNNFFLNINNSPKIYFQLTNKEKSIFRDAFKEWEKIANIKFIEDNVNANLYLYSSILNNKNSNIHDLGISYINNFRHENYILLDRTISDKETNFIKWLILHELGHITCKLNHPNPNMINEAYFIHLSIMNTAFDNEKKYIYPSTLTSVDIKNAQLQLLPNTHYNNGNDTYKFNGKEIGYFTIYDTGGIDIIDLSQINSNLNISLSSGVNNINKLSNTSFFSIAINSDIENITLGNGKNKIQGNKLNNHFYLNKGDDTIEGLEGNNTYVFTHNSSGIKTLLDFNCTKDKLVFSDFEHKPTNIKTYYTSNNMLAIEMPHELTIIIGQHNQNITEYF